MAEMIRLGDVATYINGYAFKPEDRGEEGLPIIRIQDLTGNSYDLGFYNGEYPEKIEINDGDVLISWSASLGVYIWNRGKALLNQHIFKVDFDKVEIDKNYFVYAVRRKLNEMALKTHGATMKHIVKKDFDATLIPYPSMETQAEISNNLDKVSRIISAREAELRKLDELIKARFVELFGNPNFNEKQWKKGTINDIGTCVAGATPSTKVNEYWESGTIPWMSSGEVNKGRIYETDSFITQLGYENASTKMVPAKTVVLAMAGQGKTRGTAAITEIELCTNQSICSIVNNDRVNPEYLLFFLKMQYKELRGASTNTDGRGGLNLKIIGNYPIMIPPIDLQNKFADFVKQVDKSKVVVQKALDEAQLLFDSLMKEYFG